MWGFNWKRFLATLGLSISIWIVSVFIQGVSLYKVNLNLFSASSCEVTGFPIAKCIYDGYQAGIIQLINVFVWFWVIHLFWGGFEKFSNKSK